MATLAERLQTAVTKIETDADLFHNIVQGDATTVVTTENGDVNSAAKAIAEIRDTTAFFRDVTGLTGGGSTNLDGIATALFTIPFLVEIVITEGGLLVSQKWYLKTKATGEAEDGTFFVEPDDDAALIWVKVG